jgi:DNA-binding NarL/FixJ family response regulator
MANSQGSEGAGGERRSPIRVLVVDDHPLVRLGVKEALAREPDFATPGEAEDADELWRLIEAEPWDVVLLDIGLPGRSGLELLSELRRRLPSLPVIMLSVHAEEHYAVRALRMGAKGYLNKTSMTRELVSAIRQVLAGKKHVSPAVAEALAGTAKFDPGRPLHEALSARELLVVREIALGKTVTEIAAQMGLSAKTVSTYRARALQKMSMRTNAELARYAIRNGLVS